MIRKLVTSSLAIVLAAVAIAETTSPKGERTIELSVDDEVALTTADHDQITAQVLARNPLLSSSPGTKFSDARRSVWSVDTADYIEVADVIYYPHIETAGFKQAFQVQCSRQAPVESWTCGEAVIRAYLKLETQNFEVRVRDGIAVNEALALIAATRNTAQSSAINGSVVPETAIMIWSFSDKILVSWGSPEGYQDLIIEAHLRNDGDPINPDDWQANLYRPSN